MASMGEMIENIAHQWRQPLAQINSSLLIVDALMQKYDFYNEKVEEKLLEVESLTEYMSKTISNFQNYFNPNKEKDSFFLHQIITDSLEIIKSALEPLNIKITLDIDANFQCVGYESNLQQVILVILNNAKDALKLRQIPNPKIHIYAQKIDTYYMAGICDNGGGIDPMLMSKIFEPYFTTKHQSQGTGLGLYISKMIIEDALNGKLIALNKNDGACFQVPIPQGKM